MVTLLQHTIHGSSPWGNTVTYSSSGYVAKHPWDVVLRSMAISSNQLHWEQHFFVSDCRPQHTTGVMSIWRFHVCFFYRLYVYDFLEIRFIECKPWVQSTVGPKKSTLGWDWCTSQGGLLLKSTMDSWHFSQKHWLGERPPKIPFFPLRTALCSLGKRHITYDAKWQQNDPPSNVSCPSWIKQLFNLDLYIFFLSHLCLNCV